MPAFAYSYGMTYVRTLLLAAALTACCFVLAGCAATTAPDATTAAPAAASGPTGGYRQIYSYAASHLCATIDGTNTPVVNTCTSDAPGWGGSDEYYNSSNLQKPLNMQLTVDQPQSINMASVDSTHPDRGSWYVIITTTATGDRGYTNIVEVPQGQGILITRVANSAAHPGSSSIFCLPQSQIQSGSFPPGQRYTLCSPAGTARIKRGT